MLLSILFQVSIFDEYMSYLGAVVLEQYIGVMNHHQLEVHCKKAQAVALQFVWISKLPNPE